MKRFASFAMAAAMGATPVLAETHMGEVDYAQLIRTRDITGGEVYTFATPLDDDTWGAYEADAIGNDWNEIGEIEDVILDRSGQMIGVVAEVGGFLDIGDKHVMIPVENLRLTPIDDRHYAIVTRYTEEQLEELQSVDEGWWD
ncbi:MULTISPECIES: PRC-barrel domain-containing protein [unclassified Sulfitobacter]|uniref:PRC-barrel domain-containing protein n=1 Tax=unclassified Sulfitobacter TaxID=196795 RepID=UPI0007C3005F|nr:MULTISPECIES: PRC-barrel domain-containing protein [unclassified Sulfitobacter]KZX94511.1 photosystem reaction center subunit H [Sulfitobacter sp. HI0023]KZY23837.1 photosystem reaction center subunit H [Sulfitobacter sp. HI0040]KZZ67167.1 photosystem reaction center subunit H [Sulfitobacter sp. HI0129]MBO29351.1 photosystem reaction center subunit H [Paracoccaceae bacterium]|tara:strand:- start:376 stop:804 length:429 start_codon:yes stop_codon:yes gene_type:complete